MKRNPAMQRGFALLIVLWTLALLALLGSQLLVTTRQDALRARNQFAAAEVAAAADGAVQRAIFALSDTSGRGWQADGVWHVLAIDGVGVAIRIEDEAGKVNPNLASVPLLQALLIEVGSDAATAARLAASIAEWRGATDLPRPMGDAELRYRASGLAYAPSGAPFEHLDELAAVLGMTPELLVRLKPHLTLFSDTDADPASRDPIVARALLAAGELASSAADAIPDLVSVSVDAEGPAHTPLAIQYVIRLNVQAPGRRWSTLARERLPR
jgi:general secretion pathway protein K